MDKAVKNLADAIVLQAIIDYKKALKTNDKTMIADCERFFRSNWFSALSDYDGTFIMNRCKKYVLN